MIIILIIYHTYIQSELYNFVYRKVKVRSIKDPEIQGSEGIVGVDGEGLFKITFANEQPPWYN